MNTGVKQKHTYPFSNAANRLDRLPISRVHFQVLTALGIVYFFDLADLFTLSNVAPALIEHWGIQLSTIANVTAASFLGMFLGASLGGRLSDRIGRKKALNLFVFIFSIASLCNAAAWDIPSLMAFRFLTGFGVAAAMIITNSYLAEFFPSSVRGKYISFCAMIGLIGVPITNIVSAFVIPLGSWGWRLVFVWGAVGLIYFFFIRRLEESPRWHENRGEYEKADAILKRIEASVEKEKGPLPAPAPQTSSGQVQHAGYAGLLKGRNLKITIVLSAVWIFETFGFYGFASWVPSLLKSNGVTMENTLWYNVLHSVGAPLGALLGSMISEKFQRKWILAASAFLTAIAGLLYGMTFIPIMIIVFGFIVNITERVFTSNLYAYTSEPFPTEYRSSGSGLAYGLGRFSNIFGSLLVGFIAVQLGYVSVFFFIGGCWLACSILLICFGPNTNAKQI
ncbi:putative metabolite transport protein YyaJ [Bacillus subtilis]|uniref:MFS transporter n=1 Tax=Bacillus TaxID=1386 RepID=UPI00075133E6|nr:MULTISPECIES: MFS transporter [Bacillus]BDG82334.1 putative metabolite transport protein YyaJ [Bacillus subtilis]KUP36709.1 MFS transporter [Bacillus halotolerans]MEC0250556.1 MFS transporter [Bacillus halotolerans]MEC0357483.1 MFS transporter [Bacillus halotolerans]OEC78655.1 MFS transporter [Bacillus halotolerans]